MIFLGEAMLSNDANEQNRTSSFTNTVSEKKCRNFLKVSSFSDSYKSIVEFIDAQFEAYLQEELKIKRTLHSYHDTRIHACLYFIAPTGHSLKSLDLVTMKKLDSKVRFTWCIVSNFPVHLIVFDLLGGGIINSEFRFHFHQLKLLLRFG